MTITKMQYVLMFLGILTSLLIFFDSNSKKSEKSWLKRNWMKILLSLIVSYVAVVLGPDTFKILGIDIPEGSNLPNAHAFLCGVLSDAIVFALRRLLLKLKPTSATSV